jgi:methyl-accepting chemotaxis protein
MFQSMKIKTRILGILGILATGYLILLVMVQISASITHQRMSQISASLFPAALRMQEAEAAFERMKKHYGDAVVLQDAAAITGAEKDAEEVTGALDAVRTSLAAISDLQSSASNLSAEFAALRSRDHDTYGAVLASKGGPTDDMMAQIGILGKDNKTLTDAMSAFDKAIAADFQRELDSVDAWSLRSKFTGLVMLVFAILSCASAWWVVQFKVVVPLRSLSLRIQDIAEGDGDLTRRVEVTGRNEIDEVGLWFNTFLDKLQDVMRQVKSSTQQLTEASSQLAASASGMAEGADAQQGQTSMVASAMHEMAATVTEVARNSSDAASMTRKASEDARDGGREVEQTVVMMRAVTDSVNQVAKQIAELGNRSNQVGQIVDVIDEIAGRTNLLALNAAIEAARAGEQGRGFAVVAGEVRNLAERTTNATKEIAAMIGRIQQETKAAVLAIDGGTSQVQKGVAATGEAGERLQKIISGAQDAAGMVNLIAAAAAEQTSATHEINRSINEIARISNETAHGARQSAKACEALNGLASNLNSLISRFRVGEDEEPMEHSSNWAGSILRAGESTSSNQIPLQRSSGMQAI